MAELSRRSLLAGAATVAAATALAPAVPGQAAAPPAGKQAAGLLSLQGRRHRDHRRHRRRATAPITDAFVVNVKKEEVNAALVAAFMEPGVFVGPYNPIVLNTGGKLALVDTGTSEAGYTAQQRRRRPVHDQSRGRRHRGWRDRHRDHLSFPRRPHQRSAQGRQVARRFRTPKSWCPRTSTSSIWTTAT